MTDGELVTRAVELLDALPYFNVASEGGGQPWNSPVWAARDGAADFYWSSWVKAEHSENIAANPRTFLTVFDSTRARGTNHLRCLYLQCLTVVVEDEEEVRKAAALLYPGEAVRTEDFLGEGQKRFYRATPVKVWLNCLSERELTPSTLKMRTEIDLGNLKAELAKRPDPVEIALLRAAYGEFNGRDIDAALRLMTADVAWPRAFKGGFVNGPEEVRAYWTEQWGEIDPRVEPVAFRRGRDGRVAVEVRQVVRDLSGQPLADGTVTHEFVIADGRIRRMEVV